MDFFVWQRTVVDEAGNVLPSASVSVTDVVSGALAQLYSDEGVTGIGNPITADANGFAQFYVKSGVYDIVSTLGAESRTWSDEQIGSPERITDAEVTATVTPTNYGKMARPEIDVLRYTSDGETVTSAAISAACNVASALGGAVIKIDRPFDASASVAVPANTTLKGMGRAHTIATKIANIDMFTLAEGARLEGLGLHGDGSNFTGAGIVISSGNNQRVIDCDILDMDDYCVEFVGATIGSFSHIVRCYVGRTDPADAAIVLPDDGLVASYRHITDCITVPFQILVDCGAAQVTFIRGNSFNNMVFGTSKKTIVNSNRIATTGGALNIDGEDNVVVGNAIAGAPTLVSGAARCVVRGNVSVDPPVDNSGSTGTNANWVDIPWGTYSCTWTASSVNPTLGDGSLSAYFSRDGRNCTVRIELTIGSSTSMGTGTWRYSTPFGVVAGPNHFGALRILDSGTAFLTGIAVANASTSYVTAYSHNTPNEVNPTTPITFATGDTIQLEVTFSV